MNELQFVKKCLEGDEKGENENYFIGRIFFNAICLRDTKEKHKEIQQLHLVCGDLPPLMISDPAVSISQTQKLDKGVLGDHFPL